MPWGTVARIADAPRSPSCPRAAPNSRSHPQRCWRNVYSWGEGRGREEVWCEGRERGRPLAKVRVGRCLDREAGRSRGTQRCWEKIHSATGGLGPGPGPCTSSLCGRGSPSLAKSHPHGARCRCTLHISTQTSSLRQELLLALLYRGETEAERNLLGIIQVGNDSARGWDQARGVRSLRSDAPALLCFRHWNS